MNSKAFRSNKMTKGAAYFVLGLYTIIVAYPLIFLFITSLKTNAEFFTNLFGLAQKPEWSNYANAWTTGKLGFYFGNSMIITISSVIATSIFSLLGGYALGKLNIPKANLIMSILMVFNFIPGIAIYISLFQMLGQLKMTSSYFAIIIPYIAWHLPFSMYIFKQYFETIPHEMIESGRIDGCTELKTFTHIMLPLVTPALATVIVFTFIGNWGELIWASIVTSSNVRIKTLPVGLLNFRSELGIDWGMYTAGISMVTLPLMCVFAYFQKYFVAGLTNGAVKG
jgi:raffinose/stachyose/melibiose transport system permease protein